MTMVALYSTAISNVSVPSTELTTLRDFVLEKSFIYPLLFLYVIRIMYPPCEDPSLFLLKYPSERTRIFKEFMSSS